MDPISSLILPILTLHPSLSWDYLISLLEDPSSPQTLAALQIPLREAQSPMICDQEGQIQGRGWTFFYQSFDTTDFLSWKHHASSFTERLQTLINLVQSIIQTHKPT
jgi:hypothetical protein